MTVKLNSIELQVTDIRKSFDGTVVSNKDRFRECQKTLNLKIDENKIKIVALQYSLKSLESKYASMQKGMGSIKSEDSLEDKKEVIVLSSSGDSTPSEEDSNVKQVSRDDLMEIKKRINDLEMINPLSGFFAWRLRDFEKFRRNEPLVKREKFKTSCFGFECRIVLYWNNLDLRRRVNLAFEVVGLTPMTVSFLPFFCDVVISIVCGDSGEIMTREISCTEFTQATSDQDWDCICRAVVEDFLVLPDHEAFVSDDTLKMFGYFKPYDPSVEIVSD